MRAVAFASIVLCLLLAAQLEASPSYLHVSNAWVNEAPPGVGMNAAYMLIENPTGQTVMLNKIDSPDYEHVEIHRSILVDGTASMQLLTEVEITAGGRLEFSPGNYHLMLFNPRKQFHTGDMVSFILYFADELQINVDAQVKKLTLDHNHH